MNTPRNNPRTLHTKMRVRDLALSYRDKLGMDLVRRLDFADDRFTLVYLGYGGEDASADIELTHNWIKKDLTRLAVDVATSRSALRISMLTAKLWKRLALRWFGSQGR